MVQKIDGGKNFVHCSCLLLIRQNAQESNFMRFFLDLLFNLFYILFYKIQEIVPVNFQSVSDGEEKIILQNI